MTLIAAAAVAAAFVIATILALPAARRTGLGIWHPAVAWLALEALFFGPGSAILALPQAPLGPAWFVAGSTVAFGAAVAISDRWARRRTLAASVRGSPPAPQRIENPHAAVVAVGVRWPLVLGMVIAGIAVLMPTLVAVGIPALASDVTGARTAIGGLDVQVIRVAVPAALVLGVVVAWSGETTRFRALVAFCVILAVVAEIALASRYLAAELAAALVIGLALAGRPLGARILAAAVL